MRPELLRAEIKKASDEALNIVQAAKAEGRDQLTKAEQARFAAARDKAEAARAQLDSNVENILGSIGIHGSQRAGAAGVASGSLGGQIVASTEFREAQARQFAGGMAPITISASTLSAVSGGGSLLAPYILPGVTAQIFAPPTVASVVPTSPTDSPLVKTITETATNGAAEVSGEGDEEYPESGIVFGDVNLEVKKLATSIVVTDDMLQDIAGLASYIDQRLRTLVMVRLDGQLLNGDGVGKNVQGVIPRGDLGTPVDRLPAETYIDCLGRAKFQIEAENPGMVPSAIIVNPVDLGSILLSKDGVDRHLVPGFPFTSSGPGQLSLFGAALVPSSRIAIGTALVGAFAQASTRFTRASVVVEISKSHSDFFAKGRNLIRCTLRTTGAHLFRPSCFVVVDLEP